MTREALTITDERNGATYEIPIEDAAIRATDLQRIKAVPGDGGLLSYDPSLANTATCKSAIGFVDGAAGVLR